MSNERSLVLLKNAQKALAEARTIDEFKDVRDVGEAAVRWAKSRRDIGIESLNDAAEIVRRAERKLGLIIPKHISPGEIRNQTHMMLV